MDTSLAHENARLRALLQTQQDTIRQMAEYNRLLSQRVAAYASEINRLKALVAKLQRMQFGKSSEKLRAKTERQIQEAQERISALQEEMAETLGEQYDPVLPSALRQSSARKPLPASLPRETRVIRPEEECCPACGGELSSLGCDVSEQLELISSAFKVIETQRPKQACCRCDHIVQASTFKTHCTQLCRSGASGPCCHREICRPSAVIPPVRNIPSSGSGAEPCHTGALDRCCC
ncbi:IS66 family transposase zinc-finger binding domain-containing protein [Escherichia coli]|uniref:IS66 family transposase n=1 Tax=Escherichia coli TaxID=562 RepID=UPI00388D100A